MSDTNTAEITPIPPKPRAKRGSKTTERLTQLETGFAGLASRLDTLINEIRKPEPQSIALTTPITPIPSPQSLTIEDENRISTLKNRLERSMRAEQDLQAKLRELTRRYASLEDEFKSYQRRSGSEIAQLKEDVASAQRRVVGHSY